MAVLSENEIEKRVADSYELPNRVLDTMPEPLVTVRTSTYQHAPFIRECIEGVLMQKTDFPVEFIIGEDCSTDGTRELVKEYAQAYPNAIRVLTADYNVGAKANGRRCRRASRGKYMALCEGDDYWTDPRKLQKQVDLFEGCPEMSISGHYVSVVRLGDRPGASILPKAPGGASFTMVDVLSGHLLGTCSMMFRVALLDSEAHRRLVRDLPMGDVPLLAMLAERGQIGFVPECMGVYRIHGGGVWSPKGKPQKLRDNIMMLGGLRKHLGAEHHVTIDGILWRKRRELVLATLREGKRSEASQLARQHLSACRSARREPGSSTRGCSTTGQALGLVLRCHLPFLFRMRRVMRAAWRELRRG